MESDRSLAQVGSGRGADGKVSGKETIADVCSDGFAGACLVIRFITNTTKIIAIAIPANFSLKSFCTPFLDLRLRNRRDEPFLGLGSGFSEFDTESLLLAV